VLGLIDKDLQAFLLQTDPFVTHYNNSFKLCIADGTFDTGSNSETPPQQGAVISPIISVVFRRLCQRIRLLVP